MLKKTEIANAGRHVASSRRTEYGNPSLKSEYPVVCENPNKLNRFIVWTVRRLVTHIM
jgi:hypothetical protein